MTSRYDLPGIHAAGSAYAHAGRVTAAAGDRVRRLRHAQAEAHAPARVDLVALHGELARLSEALAEDGRYLSRVSRHMADTERQVAGMLAGQLGPGAALFVRLARKDARAMLRRDELADMTEDIRYGSTGPRVAALQRRLRAAGCDPGPVDGIYGPLTRRAVRRYQRKHHLPVTGEVDGGTVRRLVNPAHRPSTVGGSSPTPIGGVGAGTAHDVVRLAESQLGEGEHPPGSNNTKYGSWYSPRDPAEPWCARFVSWVYAKAGHPLPAIDGAKGFQYCPDAVNWARRHGVWHAGTGGVRPGDIVLFDWNGDGVADHTGIATSHAAADGSVHTVEGNAENVVGRHVRGRGVVLGHFRP
jgi:peptidoglycan hydrolase-like protein with peptidoglycan-binding domain